jgi:hypothetical protein
MTSFRHYNYHSACGVNTGLIVFTIIGTFEVILCLIALWDLKVFTKRKLQVQVVLTTPATVVPNPPPQNADNGFAMSPWDGGEE